MYKIEEKPYGLHITMGSLYAPDEMKNYIKEKELALKKYVQGYSLFVDLRSAIPPNEEDAELLRDSQARSDEKLIRQVLITHSPVVRQRANQLIISGPIQERTRIINSAVTKNWHEMAMRWILEGVEPEEIQSQEFETKI